MAKKSKKGIASLRSNIRIELSNILNNAHNVMNHMKASHPKATQPEYMLLGKNIREYLNYHHESGGFNAYFTDKDGVLYEISVFRR